MDVLGYRPNVSYVLAFTGTSAQSTTGSLTNALLIRVVADADCFISMGTNPTAVSTTGIYMPAGCVEYFKYSPGSKIAAIQKTGAGNLYISEMSR